MTRPAVTYPRAVTEVIDVLTPLLAGEATVGYGLPADWTPRSDPHLQVASDGTPGLQHPVAQTSTIRLVGWSQSPTESERLVLKASGLLYAHVGDLVAKPTTGPLPVTDPDHDDAELCAVTLSVRVRSTPIT